MEENKYWDYRGSISYEYKGETFYTITPIPYYYARRKCILKMLYNFINRKDYEKICDYGCGDGVYLSHLKEMGLKCDIHGVDISFEMIERAKANCKGYDNVFFYLSDGKGINNKERYDCIFSSAVFAHIDDSIIKSIFNNLGSHLNDDNGYLVFCEQVGKKHIKGDTYIRRTIDEYKDFLDKTNFDVEKVVLIDFWLHRLIFERKIAKKFYGRIKITDNSKKRIIANKSKWFRFLSTIFTLLSIPHTFDDVKNGWGYAFFVAKKR